MSLMHFDDGQIRRKSIFAGPQRMVMKNSTRRDNNAANQAIIVESKPDIQHRVATVPETSALSPKMAMKFKLQESVSTFLSTPSRRLTMATPGRKKGNNKNKEQASTTINQNDVLRRQAPLPGDDMGFRSPTALIAALEMMEHDEDDLFNEIDDTEMMKERRLTSSLNRERAMKQKKVTITADVGIRYTVRECNRDVEADAIVTSLKAKNFDVLQMEAILNAALAIIQTPPPLPPSPSPSLHNTPSRPTCVTVTDTQHLSTHMTKTLTTRPTTTTALPIKAKGFKGVSTAQMNVKKR